MKLVPVLEKCYAHLSEEKLLKTLDLTDDEKDLLKVYQFLTIKPMIFVTNVSEDDIAYR